MTFSKTALVYDSGYLFRSSFQSVVRKHLLCIIIVYQYFSHFCIVITLVVSRHSESMGSPYPSSPGKPAWLAHFHLPYPEHLFSCFRYGEQSTMLSKQGYK